MPAHWQRVVKYPPLCRAGGIFWSRSVETTISDRFIFIWRQVDKKDKSKLYLTRNVDVWRFWLLDDLGWHSEWTFSNDGLWHYEKSLLHNMEGRIEFVWIGWVSKVFNNWRAERTKQKWILWSVTINKWTIIIIGMNGDEVTIIVTCFIHRFSEGARLIWGRHMDLSTGRPYYLYLLLSRIRGCVLPPF